MSTFPKYFNFQKYMNENPRKSGTLLVYCRFMVSITQERVCLFVLCCLFVFLNASGGIIINKSLLHVSHILRMVTMAATVVQGGGGGILFLCNMYRCSLYNVEILTRFIFSWYRVKYNIQFPCQENSKFT